MVLTDTYRERKWRNYMKKVVVFTRSVLLLSTFLLVLLLGGNLHTEAATYDKVINLQMVTKKCTNPNFHEIVEMENHDDHIANIKSSSKNLRAKVSLTSKMLSGTNEEEIDICATKKGKYKLTFDIVDGDGNLRSKESIKIYVRTVKETLDSFKSIKIGRKEIKNKLLKDEYTTQMVDVKKAGKLKIKMRRKCKLINICVKRDKKLDSPQVNGDGSVRSVDHLHETIQNNSNLTLSDAGYNDGRVEYEGTQTLRSMKSIYGITVLELTYIDKNGALGTMNIKLRSVNR